MRVKLEGNHSTRMHCGCTAVWESLGSLARQNGWKIVTSGSYDALIMNGEGTMHHSSGGWHHKMKTLAEALSAGKCAYLVNSVWQENGAEYDDVLRALSGIWVREVASCRDLRDRHGIEAHVSPDIAFFHRKRAWLGVRDFRGQPVMTDFFSEEFANFALPRTAAFKQLKPITLRGSWGAFTASLRSAAFIATGRHHAVYAACVARVPFAAMEGNTHKISGLIETAGVNIPIARNLAEMPNIIASIDANRGEYQALFDWLESQQGKRALPEAPELQ